MELITAAQHAGDEIRPFRVDVPQGDLDDLRERLARTRWPDELPGVGWAYGIPLGYVKELAEYWRTAYDWRAHEAELNTYPQFTTVIDGQVVHFLHVRSSDPDAVPLLVTHGWPGSVAEMMKIIEPLSEDFHVVVPSLPGFGFSGATTETGWDLGRVTRALGALMERLGYERFAAHGGDWGAGVTRGLGVLMPERVIGAHLTLLGAAAARPNAVDDDDPEIRASARKAAHFQREETGYSSIQGTRPQTLAYGLTDSPAGQLAWIAEKFKVWTDSRDRPEDAVDRDQLLTNVSIYWFTATAGSSARIYYETRHAGRSNAPSTVPTAVAVFAHEISTPVRRYAERDNVIARWTEFAHGGHFAAMEQPEALVDDIRAFFRPR